MSKQAWIIFVAVCAVLLGAMVWLAKKDTVDVSQLNSTEVISSSDKYLGDHVFGNKKASVVLVEYGDYQCPGCEAAYEPIKAVAEKYKTDVAFVFRNYPLTAAHANAKAAAAAAEAAGLQGKFWEMHDKLYESQSDWSQASGSERTDIFANYAGELGLDIDQFKSDLTSDEVSQKIDTDMALGKKDGVTGTPTFFVNGEEVDQYVKDGKLVEKSEPGAEEIWSDADSFGKYVIEPAIKAAQ